MNRRDSLATLLGKKKSQKTTATTMAVTGLTPYIGPWEFKQAAHLLRRTTFGPNWGQIQSAISDGLDATIAQLLTLNPLSQNPDPPINYYYEDDPDVPVGETWVNASFYFDHRQHRMKSLEGWTLEKVMNERTSILEKMTLFWHNHFVTANFTTQARYKYKYISSIRNNALGNFRDLTKIMTVDPLMLRYLNGSSNTKIAPNENYARELLELFTIGKGPIIGPGDYSNYTEKDISEIARILTGWRHKDNNPTGSIITSEFFPNNHDLEDKQLSYHFNDEIITNGGENEYQQLIDIIFQQHEVSKFICRKIYRWFVHYEITEDIEINIIEPLAQILRDNDYEISFVLESLFTSEHFFDNERIGCMVKNPWDFLSGIKQFEVLITNDPAVLYETYRVLFVAMAGLQMEYYNPPSVAGWASYYQAPNYYRLWLNSVTMSARFQGVTTIAAFGIPLFVHPGTQTSFAPIDYLKILNNLSDPFDVNVVIDDFVLLLLPKNIEGNQKIFLKDILTGGLPDFEWNDEYSLYLSNPNDSTISNSINAKIRNLVIAMMSMPEYQLM